MTTDADFTALTRNTMAGDVEARSALADWIADGRPIDADMLALLVSTYRRDARRGRGRPVGSHVLPVHQTLAALDYMERFASAPRGSSETLKREIGNRHGVDIKTMENWIKMTKVTVTDTAEFLRGRGVADADLRAMAVRELRTMLTANRSK